MKEDAKVIGELVFDVNTACFERSGGYEFVIPSYKPAGYNFITESMKLYYNYYV